MNIELHQLLPLPMQDRSLQHSEIWESDLVLEQGENYFINAPSGSGKSTLIHILYGLRSDYSGIACWSGREIKNIAEATWAEWRAKNISIVFQDLRLFEDLSVEENLLVKHALYPELPLATLKTWVERMGMASKWNQIAGTLSYGEQQRVAILRSLIQPFDWLLLDEPFSHLDQDNIEIAAEIIESRTNTLQAGVICLDLDRQSSLPYAHSFKL